MNTMPNDPIHDPEPSATANAFDTLERRGDARDPAEAQVSIHVETLEFGGTTKNISQAGVFFFSPDQLRVSVQVTDVDGTRTAQGNLVRVERVDGETTGFAVEFDQ